MTTTAAGSVDGIDSPGDRLAALEAQVARLQALESARSLLHDYGRACDVNDVDGVTELFTPGADLQAGAQALHGRGEISAFYGRALGVPTCHIVGVPAQAGGTASSVESRATFVAIELTPGEPRLVWGTYVDRIVIDADRARFAARHITIDGRTGL